MDNPQAITVIPDSQMSVVEESIDLAYSGAIANQYAQQSAFEIYHRKRAQNTQDRQIYDLRVFCQYLEHLKVKRTPEQLYQNAEAWRGIEYGHVSGFVEWQRLAGFAVGSIKVRLSTVKRYCTLAHQSGVIPAETHSLIRTVQGYTRQEGIHIDEDRAKQGIATRQGAKKPEPTKLTRQQVRRLKVVAVDGSTRSRRRAHDVDLEARDTLLVHLFTEHGLRCSEVVSLNIEHFNLETQEMYVYRSKTAEAYVYQIAPATFEALCTYLATQGRANGPLFLGYGGQRIKRRALNARVKTLGLEATITAHETTAQGSPLSPHDLRDRWAYDVIQAGNTLDAVQYYGGWNSAAMPLHYAKKAGVAYGRLKLPD